MQDAYNKTEILQETTLQQTTPNLIGTMVGRYQIQSKLGEGGMGTVYMAEDTKLKRTVALKMISPRVASDPQAMKRFELEATATAQLRHPNIVVLYNFERVEEHCFITMDHIDGHPLDQVLEKHKLSFRKCCEIMLRVLKAIEHAHEKGIVHRDLKPSNILLDKNGTPFITDFGLAKAFTEGSTGLSQAGMLIGTPAYMAPEQAKMSPECPVDGRSDVYSLGVVFYEMLTRRRPIDGKNPLSILYKLANEEIQTPIKFNAKIPKELEKICMKALEKEQSKRYQKAKHMADDVRKYLLDMTKQSFQKNVQEVQKPANPIAQTVEPKPKSSTKPQIPQPKVQIPPTPKEEHAHLLMAAIAGTFMALVLVVTLLYLKKSPKKKTAEVRKEITAEEKKAQEVAEAYEKLPTPDWNSKVALLKFWYTLDAFCKKYPKTKEAEWVLEDKKKVERYINSKLTERLKRIQRAFEDKSYKKYKNYSDYLIQEKEMNLLKNISKYDSKMQELLKRHEELNQKIRQNQ